MSTNKQLSLSPPICLLFSLSDGLWERLCNPRSAFYARWSDAESMPGCAGASAGAATGTINAINAINAIPAERGRPQ